MFRNQVSGCDALCFAICLVFLASCGNSVTTSVDNDPPAEQSTTTTTGLSPDIPHAITVTVKPPTLESLQDDFDVFSWESFIALNWPVNPDGTPDKNAVIGKTPSGDNPTVWERWMQSTSVFLEDGSAPAPFGSAPVVPDLCEQQTDGKVLASVGKTPNLLEASSQPFKTGPLIDQNGNYTRFEIMINKTMYDYIVTHKLYNRQGQRAFDKDVDFPSSDPDPKGKIGAIMVKASWRLLKEGEDPSRFHTSESLVYSPEFGPDPAKCEKVRVALVGLHIAQKTVDEPQWIWSTFEHIDNCPDRGEVESGAAKGKSYLYYNPDCSDCLDNEPPPRPWNPGGTAPPTQVVREIAITPQAGAINDRFHKLLAEANPNSVWLNYELISTQWPTIIKTDPTATPEPEGRPAPQFLANTTLETYIQGTQPNVSSSCIACHNNATTTTARFSDFTFVLDLAREKANGEGNND